MEHWILELIETRRGRWIVAVLTMLVGVLFCWIAWPEVHDARRLRAARAKVDAEVVATRTMRNQHFGTEYDLRYRFQVPGRHGWFTREERGTGRTDLWITVPKPQWDEARRTGSIQVVYVPDDPRINRAAYVEFESASDSTGGLLFGALCLGGGAFWLGWLTVGRAGLAGEVRR